MNIKRVVVAALAAFVVTTIIGVVVNNSLFGWVYATSQTAMRPADARLAHLPYVMAALFLSTLAFSYLYARGFEQANGIAASIKLAMIFAVGVVLPSNAWQWGLYPIAGRVPLVVIPWEFLTFVITATIVAVVYRPIPSARLRDAALLG